MSLDFQLTVFSDPQGEAAAKVYVVAVPTRSATADELAAYRLSGQIIGPTCRYSSTLQTKIPFKHRGLTQCGDRTALVAEAIVPDPCYWSTELPFLYRAVGEIGREAEATLFEETFGIRSIGVVRKRLTFNGNIWVPRIVLQSEVALETPLTAWRDANTVMFVSYPTDELLRDADRDGVVLALYITEGGSVGLDYLRRLARHPSIAIFLFETLITQDTHFRSAAPNVLLANWYQRPKDEVESASTDLYFLHVDVDGRPDPGQADDWPINSIPLLIPLLPLTKSSTLLEARAACDRLQSVLAGKYEAAGYAV